MRRIYGSCPSASALRLQCRQQLALLRLSLTLARSIVSNANFLSRSLLSTAVSDDPATPPPPLFAPARFCSQLSLQNIQLTYLVVHLAPSVSYKTVSMSKRADWTSTCNTSDAPSESGDMTMWHHLQSTSTVLVHPLESSFSTSISSLYTPIVSHVALRLVVRGRTTLWSIYDLAGWPE